MGTYLIIGGSGVMGTAAVRALRTTYGKKATIVANWFGKEDPDYKVEGADHTVFGDITDPGCLKTIQSFNGGRFDTLFYATALGEVGIPIKMATPEQIKQSNRLSFDPIPYLEENLEIGMIVAYSTFYLLKHQLGSYGAMAHSKEAIEKWTLQPGKSRHACIRAGLFHSASSRGIKLLLRKNAKNLEQIKDPLLQSYFKDVPPSEGIKRFEKGISNEEKETYGDSGTTADSLYQAHLTLFKTENPVFVNVCGEKIWLSGEPLLLKDYLE